ncbi:hypothetical protein BDA96_06G125800 [Sorghum bicolor]|uniref:Uncharacterized protein n=1 Tax=Sorghum bicolor TaxID=4558 RepID=A0A921UCW5_SORBI|nr:hypothetical protein BDA96_06G125800 [Sorghum bicolor]
MHPRARPVPLPRRRPAGGHLLDAAAYKWRTRRLGLDDSCGAAEQEQHVSTSPFAGSASWSGAPALRHSGLRRPQAKRCDLRRDGALI